ncbi:MAG: hypothetical protein WBN28_03865 [Lutimonas sp.]
MAKIIPEINYDEQNKTFVIDDGLAQQYQFMYLLLGLNIANSIIRSYKMDFNDPSQSDYFWLVIGAISAIALLYRYFKKTTVKEIKLEEIDSFKIKHVLGNERYSLILKNGKSRNLLLDKFGRNQLREFFNELGLKISG